MRNFKDIATMTHKIKEVEEQNQWIYQGANDRSNLM